MATSKTTNTYNRQNWEDAVSIKKLKHLHQRINFINDINLLFTFLFYPYRNFQYCVRHV